MRSTPTGGREIGLILAALLAAGSALGESLPQVTIGVFEDGPWEQNEYIRELTIREVTTLTEGEFDVRFPDEHDLTGDWTYQTARDNLERLLADPEVDLVIAWGVMASQAVCCYAELPKPVVAPVIVDASLQGLPFDDGASGVSNLSYVELENKVDEELAIFRQIVPFDRIVFLSSRRFIEAIPGLTTRTFARAAEAGVDFDLMPVGDSADEVLAAIPDDAQAAYLWPLFHLGSAELQRLIDGLNARGIPTFSALDAGEVEAGVLATATSSEFFPRLARRVALNVQRILLGEDAGRIPISFNYRQNVKINMATARQIGVSPGWDVLLEADLLHPEEVSLEVMSLERAVTEAIDTNLDLAVRRRAVSAAEQDVARAVSNYRPQLEASALGALIDDDRAASSFGSQAERTTSAQLSMSQLLFSDAALAGIQIEGELQVAREQEFEALRLDIALDAATTYLNLLRVKSLVEIQRSNLRVTRSNLELAQIRRTIGAANPAEVFRWESQIAIDRKSLVDAEADLRTAEIALNRLLHRDLEQRYRTTEVDLDDPSMITGQARFEDYTETPARARVLRDFMVQEGLTVAPELKRIDAAIRAQERALRAAKRAYWSPTVAIRASLEEVLSRGGAGSTRQGLTIGDFSLPVADDTSWSIGLSAALPLYSGGSRRAEVIQADEELTRLSLQLDSVAESIATRIRIGMEIARGSFRGIRLSEQASEAASHSLELVSDAYARGAVTILDLLDAQNAALQADRLYANAIYDFFVDLMEVQRAANRFDFFLTPVERSLWYQRLDGFFERAGATQLGRRTTETQP